MDQKRAIEAFERYAGDYDPSNPMIRDKIVHTFHVAQIARRIAEGVTRPELVGFAWLLGLLHDIGRFEQVRRYGTFVDGQSVDHAELGADLLFREGLIDRFPADGLPEGWRRTAEAAIRLHNKLTLPEGLDGDDLALCRILRDADKLDIFRVITQVPVAQRAGTSKALLEWSATVSDGVMDCVRAHRCVPRSQRRTIMDLRVSHCCMAFELEYPVSRQIAVEQGHLLQLLEMRDPDGQWLRGGLEQMRTVRGEIEASWGMSLGRDETRRNDE